MNMTLGEIAKLTGARLQGDANYVITGAAGLTEAGPQDIAFLENPKYAKTVAACRAGAVFLPPSAEKTPGGPPNRLYSQTARWCHAQVLKIIYQEKWKPAPPGVSKSSEVHFEARLGKDVSVGPFSVVGRRTIVGENTRVGARCFLGNNVRIGKDCLLHPGVTIMDYCEIGDRVILHPGTVIGSDGYGYWTDPRSGEHHKVHQVGRVVLGDDVELGANVTIDRATTGETRIGSGTKIDNLVQLGHNVRVGKNCLFVAQAGIAGSTEIGRQVVLAGQAGIAGHLRIGHGAIVTAQTGVMSDVADKSIVFGSPCRPHREAMKLQALLSKLPDMYDTVKKLKNRFLGDKEAAHAKG